MRPEVGEAIIRLNPDRWESSFIERQRVARLATVSAEGGPHIVPIVFALDGERLYTPLDAKPKRVTPERLQRVRDIQANPQVAVLFDEYSEDWQKLAWVQLRGRAALVEAGPEHERGLALLEARYLQYQDLPLAGRPVIVVTVEEVVGWRVRG